MQFAPSTYYDAVGRAPSARAQRDEVLKPEIHRVHQASLEGCYGAKKIWKQLTREGIAVANCTVRRLMKEEGISGVRRGRQFKITTISDENQLRPTDLVDRQFAAAAPNRLWVADLTYVKTHTGWTYVAFVIDVFSRAIVGWQASTSLRSDLAIDALDMAIYSRNEHDLSNLIHHSDRGIQGELNRSSQHLTMMEVCGGATTAVGRQSASPGDAFARAAGSSASRRARVLASDCSRQEHRGRRSRHRGVGPRRVTLVSPRWRDGAFEPHRTDRPVLVVR